MVELLAFYYMDAEALHGTGLQRYSVPQQIEGGGGGAVADIKIHARMDNCSNLAVEG